VVSQGLPDRRDVPRQIVFLNERVRPDELNELVFLDDTIAPFNQDDENFKGFQGEWDESAGAVERAARRIGDERTKGIDPVVCAGNRTCHLQFCGTSLSGFNA
jgi:hypothetical protein